jgi:hypothetical protein
MGMAVAHLGSLRPLAANLLILRATNLCKQGVTGSIPVTSTNQFSNLAVSLEVVAETWCTFWCRSTSKAGVTIESSATRFASVRIRL